MWTDYFRMKGIRRGRIITPGHGEIDFSEDNIPVEICQELFENDFPYLDITPEGKRKLYGEVMHQMDLVADESDAVFELLPLAEQDPQKLKTSRPKRKITTKKNKPE